jgi:hypothetical protein
VVAVNKGNDSALDGEGHAVMLESVTAVAVENNGITGSAPDHAQYPHNNYLFVAHQVRVRAHMDVEVCTCRCRCSVVWYGR